MPSVAEPYYLLIDTKHVGTFFGTKNTPSPRWPGVQSVNVLDKHAVLVYNNKKCAIKSGNAIGPDIYPMTTGTVEEFVALLERARSDGAKYVVINFTPFVWKWWRWWKKGMQVKIMDIMAFVAMVRETGRNVRTDRQMHP